MKQQPLTLALWFFFPILLNAAPLTQRGWAALVETAKKEAAVIATASSTDSLGGVYTMTLDPRFFDPKNPKRKGDAALALYNGCASVFGKWARENRAETRNGSWTGAAGCILYFGAHAENGDYVSVLYQPSSVKDAQGAVTITFVDAGILTHAKPGAHDESGKAEQVADGKPSEATQPLR